MEITLKQVETLRDRAGVSEAEAREALERNGGDLLEALLDLERLGKSHTSGQGGFYSTQPKAGAGADALVLSAPAQGSGRTAGMPAITWAPCGGLFWTCSSAPCPTNSRSGAETE
jgi:hypothetical protein